MDKLYTKISTKTKKELYQYMNDKNISLLKYHFNYFFQHFVQKNQIKIIGHHFSNHRIYGMTIIDELGISFSYEIVNPAVRQNFTLCHELGHFILKHEGSYFTESVSGQDNYMEREANIFSAVVLMPDIVLLSKIYYRCDAFQLVQDGLEVSKQALYFRLLDLFREYFPNNEGEIKHAVKTYMDGKKNYILRLFHAIKEPIIEEYNKYKPTLAKRIERKIELSGFITSQDFPELMNQERWFSLKENNPNLGIWLVYNKGKSIAYAWDNSKLSENDAKKKAEQQLLLM